MPIQISYNPAASVVANSAVLGGQGQYFQYLNNLLNSQWQTSAQLNNSRLMAMQQAAAESQRQAQQQSFEMQMAPQKAFLEAQGQAYHTQLGMQADAQHQLLGSQLNSDEQARKSAQDFEETKSLASQQQNQQAARLAQQADYESARLAQQQGGQLDNQQQMAQFNADMPYVQQFKSDPFSMLRQNQQKAQQSGYGYTDDQSQQIDKASKGLSAAQEAIQNGDATMGSLLPQIRKNMDILRTVSANPGKPPDTPISQQISKGTAWFNRNAQDPSQAISDQYTPGAVPVSLNPKTGQPDWKHFDEEADQAGGENGLVTGEKVKGLQFKNSVQGEDWVSRQLDRWAKAHSFMAALQQEQYQAAYTQEEGRLRAIVQQASPGMPAAGNRLAPAQAPPPMPGQQVTPQNPQGTPPAADPAQQQPAQPQEIPAAPAQQPAPQQMPQLAPLPPNEIKPTLEYLKGKPRQQWTREDVDKAIRLKMAIDGQAA